MKTNVNLSSKGFKNNDLNYSRKVLAVNGSIEYDIENGKFKDHRKMNNIDIDIGAENENENENNESICSFYEKANDQKCFSSWLNFSEKKKQFKKHMKLLKHNSNYKGMLSHLEDSYKTGQIDKDVFSSFLACLVENY